MHCSSVRSPVVGRASRSALLPAARFAPCRSTLPGRAHKMQISAMQAGGWTPQQQPQQQQPMQQPMGQQPMGQQPRPRMPLARTPSPYQAPGPVFLDLTQVLNKQVITRTSGRCLGTISGAWLDPGAGTLVSFDLDERKQGGAGGLGSLSTPQRAGNIPLAALRQIGDVVLVHDESGLYEQDLDGRLGFVNPVGLDVRTRAGEFLGKVRDLSFSPDTGAIRRITYDEFGLPFLPISFFDCYSVAMQDIISIGRGELLVYDDAKYRERKESAGLFAAIPSLFKSLNGPSRSGGAQLALPAPGGTSDMYRLGGPGSTSGSSGGGAGGGSRFLPSDYTYEQWQADLRRWEAETGMTYEQYLRTQSQQQPAAPGPRNALPPAGRSTAAGGYGPPASNAPAAGYGAPQQQYVQRQQQRQPGYMQPQPQQQQQQPMYQQQQPSMPAWQQPQQPQQPQQQQQQQQYAPRPGQQQYAGGMVGMPQSAAGMAPAGGGGYTPGSRYAGAPGQQQGPGGVAPQQQQPPQQQRSATAPAGGPRQQQQAAGQTGGTQPQQPLRSGAGAAPGAQRPPQQQPQQQPAGNQAAATGQPQQQQWRAPQQQQQPQQQQGAAPGGAAGRPVNDWLERDTRPRIADALADGVLPSSEDAPAAPAFSGGGQQQPQQQEVA